MKVKVKVGVDTVIVMVIGEMGEEEEMILVERDCEG